MVALGYLLWPGDPRAAKENFERAAALGNPGGMHNLGVMARDAGRGDEARRWFEQAAGLGETRSMLSLARVLQRADEAGARRWYEAAAGKGSVEAMVALAQLSARKDRRAARYWLEQAAEKGDPGSLAKLGLIYQRSDRAGADACFARAAAQGHSGAMTALGIMAYREGRDDEALEWWDKAAALGNQNAAEVARYRRYMLGDGFVPRLLRANKRASAAVLRTAWSTRRVLLLRHGPASGAGEANDPPNPREGLTHGERGFDGRVAGIGAAQPT
jgi:TPR repeat protein